MSKMSEQTTPYIESFTSGKKWSNEIHSIATKELYFKYLKNFCDAVGMNPDQLIEYKVDGLRDSSLNCKTQKALVLFKPAK